MAEQIYKQQQELTRLIKRYSGRNGTHTTAIPSLTFNRRSYVTEPNYSVYKPSLLIVVQGVEEILLAQERFRYGPADYLVTSIDLPATAQVIEASPDVPYLSLKVEFTPSEILEVLRNVQIGIELQKDKAKRGMYVSQIEISLLNAVIRLIHLLDSPKDIPLLAPLFTKEIIYRILQGPYGNRLAQIAIEGSYTYRIKNVIEHIMNHYDQSIRIEDLADIANMGASSLHRNFKKVTAMSPIQFQKQLRLQEARHLLLSQLTNAAEVALRVGYESPSQFNREYSRMFGLPPIGDVKRLRAKDDKRINV
ncbi:AraC family transcriptional regulator N-terminal domain-containing protein [Priestia megaterium]